MFDQIVLQLLQGIFICETTAPQHYRWLKDVQNYEDVTRYLERIGRRLVETPSGLAFYAAWSQIGSDERNEVKRVFTTIKHQIRPVIHFLDLCMKAGKSDSSPVSGDTIEYPIMLNLVTENASLLEHLRDFSGFSKDFMANDSSPKAMLEKVLSQLERWGYIKLINKDRESYRFTGKLDYYYQVLEFLIENEDLELSQDSESDIFIEQEKLI
ncbi:MAG: condensin complex protein MksE [Methylotenera sp.]